MCLASPCSIFGLLQEKFTRDAPTYPDIDMILWLCTLSHVINLKHNNNRCANLQVRNIIIMCLTNSLIIDKKCQTDCLK
jgi:hypothetical protein